MEKELEVKVLDVDLELMEEKIIKSGGQLIADEFQINTLIDSTGNPIVDNIDAYLRIRETKDLINNETSTVLTLKENISNKDFRENLELSTDVGNKESLLLILKNLGFDKIEVGHKKRKSYNFHGARIDLDTWDKDTYPYPYIEIEVEDSKQLEEVVKKLGILEENISKKSILQLKEDLKSEK